MLYKKRYHDLDLEIKVSYLRLGCSHIKSHPMKMLRTVIVVVDLVYPTMFHPISPFMDLGIRERWTSLSPMRVARVFL